MKKVILLMLITHSLTAQLKTTGQLISLSPEFDQLIHPDSKLEILAEGFTWSEGPVWIKDGNYLLFSDVPKNIIYKWQDGKELETFLTPSGYTGKMPCSSEPGSNGLLINTKGNLVACEHGDRRLTEMPLNGMGGKFTLSDRWENKRFNSPNDVVQMLNEGYFFTDPPYGLPEHDKDPSREISEFGVYKLENGKTIQVISNLNRPNGVALSPDEKTLYVAQSDANAPFIMAYDIDKNNFPVNGRVIYDTTPMIQQGLQGLPDGLKTDMSGNIFSTGPGGILVLNSSGKLLGRIDTNQATSNCNWGGNGSYLYITADKFLLRIKTNTIGKGF